MFVSFFIKINLKYNSQIHHSFKTIAQQVYFFITINIVKIIFISPLHKWCALTPSKQTLHAKEIVGI
jgi:hypothetical protein